MFYWVPKASSVEESKNAIFRQKFTKTGLRKRWQRGEQVV